MSPTYKPFHVCVLRTQVLSFPDILASLYSLSAQLSRSSLSNVWKKVLPLIFTLAGLVTAGATCLYQKCQKDRNVGQLEEERLHRAEEQHSQGKQVLVGRTCLFPPGHRCGALHELSCVHPHGQDKWEIQAQDTPQGLPTYQMLSEILCL